MAISLRQSMAADGDFVCGTSKTKVSLNWLKIS
jgi:hypothetical protein